MKTISQLMREYKSIISPCVLRKAELHTELDKFYKEELINFIILGDEE